jgi:hypothetical protein
MLITNKSKFSLDLVTQIKSLPVPQVDGAIIAADGVVLCLQKEAAYVDMSAGSRVTFIGSKSIDTCILVYIYSVVDHLVIHVDESLKQLDLKTLLRSFNYVDNLLVSLVGGNSTSQISDGILQVIVESLCQASRELRIPITVQSQYLIENNLFSTDSKYEFIYEYVLYQADIICRKMFKEPILESDFNNLKISDFKEKRIKESMDTLNVAINIIIGAGEFFDLNDENLGSKRVMDEYIELTFQNKGEFLNEVKERVFTLDGFLELESQLESIYPKNSMWNIVFNLDTKCIHRIPGLMITPYEAERTIYAFEKTGRVFTCYDGKEWKRPVLSLEMVKKCIRIEGLVRNGTGRSLEICELMGVKKNAVACRDAANLIVKNSRFVISVRCFSCGAYEGPLQRCSRCKKVQYCGVDCQRNDWKLHKPYCQ